MADYREGQTATNPKTGQKIIFQGGLWMAAPNQAETSRSGQLKTNEIGQLGTAREAASNAYGVLGDLTRFQDLNAVQNTGGILNNLPVVSSAIGMFDPEAAQMDEITARMAPAQRVAGSGTTSDRDLALFLQASPGRTKPSAANEAIIERGREEGVRRQAYADFLDDYAAKNGTLAGAEQAFRTQGFKGTRKNPYELRGGQSRNPVPRGAYYRDPWGNLRRNDNGDSGNPIIERAPSKGPSKPKPQASVGGWKVVEVKD